MTSSEADADAGILEAPVLSALLHTGLKYSLGSLG